MFCKLLNLCTWLRSTIIKRFHEKNRHLKIQNFARTGAASVHSAVGTREKTGKLLLEAQDELEGMDLAHHCLLQPIKGAGEVGWGSVSWIAETGMLRQRQKYIQTYSQIDLRTDVQVQQNVDCIENNSVCYEPVRS